MSMFFKLSFPENVVLLIAATEKSQNVEKDLDVEVGLCGL